MSTIVDAIHEKYPSIASVDSLSFNVVEDEIDGTPFLVVSWSGEGPASPIEYSGSASDLLDTVHE